MPFSIRRFPRVHLALPPNGLLLKMPYRFIRGCQLLPRSNEYVLSGWFFVLDLQRSRP